MTQRPVIVIGPIGAGKSSLLKALEDLPDPVRKTQALSYSKFAVDTPGEYLENPFYYRVLLPTAMGSKYVLLIQDATSARNHYPPGFARGFTGQTVGVITKADHPRADLVRSRRFLADLGLSGPTLAVSAHTGDGLEALRALLGLPPAPPADPGADNADAPKS